MPACWDEFEDLDSEEPIWRIPSARMKGYLECKAECSVWNKLISDSTRTGSVTSKTHKASG